ncbi:MAG: sensor histidine kinase [Acholeplasmataceae bacterium]|nr:MAG: sensor histidine kinase [Acholeplasmataceae bacterium]
MKQIKLTTQLNLIFTIVTLLTSLLFIFALNRVFEEFRHDQNIEQLNNYFNEVRHNLEDHFTSEHNGYVIYDLVNGVILSEYNLGVLDGHYTATQVINRLHHWPGMSKEEVFDGQTYHFRIDRRPNELLIIVFTGETYLQTVGSSFTALTRISFIALVLLGNLIILMWSRITVERVKRLRGEVAILSSNDYKVPIEIDGSDEITELAQTIERMRQEIESSEKIKQEMLQNISHDFKTPIAVIQSYAEAIADGVSDIKEAQVIVKQTDILNQKVKQLLELSKLEYLKDPSEFVNVKVKDLIINIVDSQKYRTNIKFELDLDESTYFGVKENFYSAFANIVDNALRYAKTTIIIKLKQKKLTFYNDGEPISDKFLDQMFKPYEKGQNGQFGLGMSIVQRTVAHFNLQLRVENINQGVMFTIEPL